MKNEKVLTVVKIISDHGGKFDNELFEKFLDEHGISHGFSCPRTPK